MTTTWLAVKDAPVFVWAGLWRRSDKRGDCYIAVMTDCDPGLAEIHDRAPVILGPRDWQTWLTAPLADLQRFDVALPADRMEIEAMTTPWGKASAPPVGGT